MFINWPPILFHVSETILAQDVGIHFTLARDKKIIKTFHLYITRGAHTVLPPGTITDKTFDPHFEIYNFFNPFLIGPSLLTVTF